MTGKINDSVMHQKHQQEIFPVNKKSHSRGKLEWLSLSESFINRYLL